MNKFLLFPLFYTSILIQSFGQPPMGCDNGQGASFHEKAASYNCHQYVKAALLGGYVNLDTGIPTHSESNFTSFSSLEIPLDHNFIRVCPSDAKAVIPAQLNYGHSTLILTDGSFASTPNGSTEHIFKHQNPRTFTSACTEEYYAAIPNVTISGVSSVNQGMQFTLALTNNGQSFPSFLQLADGSMDL